MKPVITLFFAFVQPPDFQTPWRSVLVEERHRDREIERNVREKLTKAVIKRSKKLEREKRKDK